MPRAETHHCHRILSFYFAARDIPAVDLSLLSVNAIVQLLWSFVLFELVSSLTKAAP